MPFLPIQRGDHPDAAPEAAANPPTLDDIAKQLNFVENIANCRLNPTGHWSSDPLTTILKVLAEQDPGALIPPQVRQQLQDMVRPEAGANPNTLNEINRQLATIIRAQQEATQEATRRMDDLQDGVLGLLRLFTPASDLLARLEERMLARPQVSPRPPRQQRNHPYNMRNRR
ncbi:uncharacterized protein PGTG_11915 [Puccinia graminis f. sp. tritici CRL 75-36-700-3]|uniref:Uncharacterized protein n=1 Tax=Puccinia graminis f. sp. tritici (strain CRL 75-36-700-3 / race SCCL) TaxID=418459 RepID=E3KMN4_PUCGT|nr:uncharacterized protein PGTG_11915 [Puccinia graminis f. sp. tritici CRL 75-36-700-3]EFP85559.2 hypothetical protein PGTG_11915 [Puccinia graminis f. sp. tritici CRL 75-36-700-3]